MKKKFKCEDCERLKCPYHNYKSKHYHTIEYFCSCCNQKLGCDNQNYTKEKEVKNG